MNAWNDVQPDFEEALSDGGSPGRRSADCDDEDECLGTEIDDGHLDDVIYGGITMTPWKA